MKSFRIFQILRSDVVLANISKHRYVDEKTMGKLSVETCGYSSHSLRQNLRPIRLRDKKTEPRAKNVRVSFFPTV